MTTYGAVEDAEQPGATYDADNLRFLEPKDVSPSKRIRQWMRAGFPILIAALLMGGIVYLMTHDFSTLYDKPSKSTFVTGGSSTDSSSSSSSSSSSISEDISDKAVPTVFDKESTTTADPSCSAHPGCEGLVDNCCPTDAGDFLNCCVN